MSYATVFSPCANCNQVFGFNPHRVPSIRVNGVREPVCRECIDNENAHREANALELLPEPHADAYKSIHESEL